MIATNSGAPAVAPTPSTEAQRALFEEIASLAANARALLDLAATQWANVEACGARSQLDQLGWLADVGAVRCGGRATLGASPAEWFGSSAALAALLRDSDSG
ncbi:MAG: hypothetical protein Q8M01_15310 [Rubrivivax sp.]|nr:hypothetical protein [Rubrivivax sp.]